MGTEMLYKRPCRELVKSRVEAGVEYLHRSPASRRRRRKGSLESQTVKYGHESHGTWTRK
jgi:transposase